MIKKLALLLISGLFVFAIVNVYKNGLTFGSINALSYQEITNKNTELNKEIGTLNTLNKTEYNAALAKLESARKNFKDAKDAYDNYAASASEDEIAEANKKEEYLLDYLWIKIGNYANANNIKVLINPSATTPIIDFDVSGPYISVINFIYDLENDVELSFNVDNIIMEDASALSDTKATFTVTGVNIVTKES